MFVWIFFSLFCNFLYCFNKTYDLVSGINFTFDGSLNGITGIMASDSTVNAVLNYSSGTFTENKTLVVEKKGNGIIKLQNFRSDNPYYINKININDPNIVGHSTILMTNQDGNPLNKAFEIENNSLANVYIENISTENVINITKAGQGDKWYYIDKASFTANPSYQTVLKYLGPTNQYIKFGDRANKKSLSPYRINIDFNGQSFSGVIDSADSVPKSYYIQNIQLGSSFSIKGDRGTVYHKKAYNCIITKIGGGITSVMLL